MPQSNNLGGDNLYGDFRVYIEGVQVPFEEAQVSNTYRGLPTASVVLAPWRGFTEISKGYFPKIHIFYRDFSQAPAQIDSVAAILDAAAAGKLDALGRGERNAYKLLFEGVITSVTDSKDLSGQGGSSSIHLNCVHPHYVLKDILLRFCEANPSVTIDQIARTSAYGVTNYEVDTSSNVFFIRALSGVRPPEDGEADLENGGSDPSVLSESMEGCYPQMMGIPGITVAMWNQIKQNAYLRTGTQKTKDIMLKMFIPLLEYGLDYFTTLTGHPALEEMIQSVDQPASNIQGKNIPITYSQGANQNHTVAVPLQQIQAPMMTGNLPRALATVYMRSMFATLVSGTKGDMTSYGDLVELLLETVSYDRVVMNSPALVGVSGTPKIFKTVMKPKMYTYFSPICNVILPNMYQSMSVNIGTDQVPSRMAYESEAYLPESNYNGSLPEASFTTFRAPHSIRMAATEKANLGESIYSLISAPGMYEFGSGIRLASGKMPFWYAVLSSFADGQVDSTTDHSDQLKKAWDKYFPNTPGMNPWADLSINGIQPHYRLFFAGVDYDYVNAVGSTRSGMVQSVFNPYIVVGYPMDVVDPSPMRESYHGFCSSVTHVISAAGSAYTQIGMSHAFTFSEMATSYIPATYPYLMVALGLDDNPRIYNNEKAWKKACEYYVEVLGVGAVDPSILVSESTGKPIPVKRNMGIWQIGGIEAPSEKRLNTLYTSVFGNLALVSRNIPSILDVEKWHCQGAETFVDISMWNQGSVEISTIRKGPWVPDQATSGSTDRGRDLESSAFLEYEGRDYDNPVRVPQPQNALATPPKKGQAIPLPQRINLNSQTTVLPPAGGWCQIGSLSQASLAKLNNVHPDLIAVVNEAIKTVGFIVTSGYRTSQQQAQAEQTGKFAQGAGDRSKHRRSPAEAVDLVPCDNPGGDLNGKQRAFASKILEAAQRVGVNIRWGGTYRKPDPVHFELL